MGVWVGRRCAGVGWDKEGCGDDEGVHFAGSGRGGRRPRVGVSHCTGSAQSGVSTRLGISEEVILRLEVEVGLLLDEAAKKKEGWEDLWGGRRVMWVVVVRVSGERRGVQVGCSWGEDRELTAWWGRGGHLIAGLERASPQGGTTPRWG